MLACQNLELIPTCLHVGVGKTRDLISLTSKKKNLQLNFAIVIDSSPQEAAICLHEMYACLGNQVSWARFWARAINVVGQD